ncbi:MAG: hydroxyisourate hydrolase [candidate division Zixibacteria bacterium]|nr:hydroxyisourate hydrolase [candidate division Zixibacteria bacterium]NIR64749.1 hydroxyisourate hydrolase [candidate division Zixibacteria bacterium]NIS17192.1 hydroxyisourate hydrolase [candidate division Zixibacteria bacterium]NIS46579.1 hydroxyisourate hydrolase [candidate division Zixibacteria bacterium]NIT53545.1 hydroxyisourate hydrolase [candidate division Zixibacteria bacterium]
MGGWLKKAAIDVGTDILENADLRCSRLLPNCIYVSDLELEPGVYDITFDFVDYEGNIVASKSVEGYRVLENGLNLVQAFSLQ